MTTVFIGSAPVHKERMADPLTQRPSGRRNLFCKPKGSYRWGLSLGE